MTKPGLAFVAVLLAHGIKGALVRHAKNAVRLVLRRPLHGANNHVAWRIVAHMLGLRRIAFVTHGAALGEGACSQALGMICARVLAGKLGLPYAHSPFGELTHAAGDSAAFSSAWEKCLNLGEDFPLAAGMAGRGLDINELFAGDFYSRTIMDKLFAGVGTLVPDLRQRYWKGDEVRANGGPLRLLLHVRRGDVTASRNVHMWTDPGEIRSSADSLIAAAQRTGLPFRLVIVSQGAIGDFPELEGLDCEFALDEPALVSFARLASADVLVMAKSSYSYMAALLCRGIVAAGDCGYPRQPEWLTIEGGRLDEAGLADRLARARG